MKFHVLSNEGDGLGLALRLRDEQHDVTVSIRSPKAQHDYDGLLRKVPFEKFNSALTKDTIVIFDSVGFGKMAERLRGQGYAVIGGSALADQLELDRAFALGIMDDYGIKVPPSEHFTDWPSAISYAEAKQTRMALKTDGNAPSFLADSPEQLIALMKLYQKQGLPADFELQDFVKGYELSTEGWFDGGNFSRPFNHTFERKQLMNGNVGPSGGCSFNVVFACPHDYCRVCQEGIARLAPLLRHHNYVGMVDLNTIVNDEGVWALELTPRFGYEAWPAMMEMLTEPLGEFLAHYARGERMPKFPMQLNGYGSALRVSIPPYPFEDADAPKGIPIQGLTRNDRIHSSHDQRGRRRNAGHVECRRPRCEANPHGAEHRYSVGRPDPARGARLRPLPASAIRFQVRCKGRTRLPEGCRSRTKCTGPTPSRFLWSVRRNLIGLASIPMREKLWVARIEHLQ